MKPLMQQAPRHQCLIYDGPPSRSLPGIASVMSEKLSQRHRCLYLNSPPMVAGFKSYLAIEGVDVEKETTSGNLVLSSQQLHLVNDWHFDVDRMIESLHRALGQALADGYQGLWATGDMSWEFGPARDLTRLLEYEWRLEEFMRDHPQMAGICQYHADSLPRHVLREGLQSHSQLFINATLSLINPHFLHPESFMPAVADPHLDHAIDSILKRESIN